jgi:hypothetical protein
MNRIRKIIIFLSFILFGTVLSGTDRKNILVIIEINDSSGKINKQFLTTANDLIRKDLAASGNFIIMDKSQQAVEFKEFLKKESGITNKNCVEKSCQIIFARSLSADTIFRPTISFNGKNFEITSEIIDIAKETSLSETTVEFNGTLNKLKMAVKETLEKTLSNYTKKPIMVVTRISDNSGKMKQKQLDITYDNIRKNFIHTGKFIVVDNERYLSTLNEMLKKDRSLGKCKDKNCQIIIAKSLSADKLLFPSIIYNNKNFSVSMEVVDLKEDTVDAETSLDFNGKSNQLESVFDELLEEIKDELEIAEEDAQEDLNEDVTPLPVSKQKDFISNRPYFWIGTGVAAGGLAITIIAIGLDAGAAKKFNDFKNKSGDPELRKDGIAMSKTGFAFYAIGGTAIITGAVLALITKKKDIPISVQFDSKKIVVGYTLNF